MIARKWVLFFGRTDLREREVGVPQQMIYSIYPHYCCLVAMALATAREIPTNGFGEKTAVGQQSEGLAFSREGPVVWTRINYVARHVTKIEMY